MAIIVQPVRNIFCFNDDEFALFSARQRGQTNNAAAFRLVFSAVPSNGQKIFINFFAGSVVLTAALMQDDSGETFTITPATVANWVAQQFVPQVSLNWELTQHFIITANGTSVFFKPLNYNQELTFALGAGTTAPVTQNVATPVNRDKEEADYVLAVRIFADVFGTDQKVLATEYYQPVMGNVRFRPGDVLKDYIDTYLPGRNIIANDLSTIYPFAHRLWGYDVSEYRKSDNSYFILERSTGRVAIKGGLGSKRFNNYLGVPQLYQLSNFNKKRVTRSQVDYIFFLITETVANTNHTITKTINMYLSDGNIVSFDQSVNVVVPSNRIIQVNGGYTQLDLASQLSAAQIPMLVQYEVVITHFRNGTDALDGFTRTYQIEEDHFLDKFLMYQSSFGVPESIRLRAGWEVGPAVSKSEFIKSSPVVTSGAIGNIDHYDVYFREEKQLSTGYLPKNEAYLLTDLVISREVVLHNGAGGDLELVKIDGAKYSMIEDLEDCRAFNITLKSATKEVGIVPRAQNLLI